MEYKRGLASLFFIMKLLTYYHTLKYVKFSQIYYRIAKRFTHPTPKEIDCKLASLTVPWVNFRLFNRKLFEDNRVRFLNKDGVVKSSGDWNDTIHEKLWLYNLHYFDDLSAIGSEGRAKQQVDFINKWITENPAPIGNGWEPYPSSLRIVNWIKAFLSGIEPKQAMLDSLAKQADYLSNDLEFHLLGNHLLANAKALIFAGLYFDGNEAKSWLATGLDIYNRELDEQVLNDGGNFELSPMYHAIILIDLLDLINIFTAYSHKIDDKVIGQTKLVACKMLEWLKVMTHDDGEISFFNDSAIGITAKPQLIHAYADALGFAPVASILPPYIQLPESGYSRITMPGHSVLFDHAKVGPDYLPGHAHADSLSLEWSVGLQRVLVNSGTSLYGYDAERHRQRQTASHNTVVVDGQDSSEVWSGFRVAKRAYVQLHDIKQSADLVEVVASHNGFMRLKGKVTHTRAIAATPDKLRITDSLTGQWSIAEAMFHLHPDIEIVESDSNSLQLVLPNKSRILVSSNGPIVIESSTWHPQFGLSIPNKKFKVVFSSSEASTTFSLVGN